MKTFFKWVLAFILGIVMIVAANMAYDYIKLLWWGSAIEEVIDTQNNSSIEVR